MKVGDEVKVNCKYCDVFESNAANSFNTYMIRRK